MKQILCILAIICVFVTSRVDCGGSSFIAPTSSLAPPSSSSSSQLDPQSPIKIVDPFPSRSSSTASRSQSSSSLSSILLPKTSSKPCSLRCDMFETPDYENCRCYCPIKSCPYPFKIDIGGLCECYGGYDPSPSSSRPRSIASKFASLRSMQP
jgi:hypothetical protein